MKKKLIYTLTGSILTAALVGNVGATSAFAETITDSTQISGQESAYTEEVINDSSTNNQESNDVTTEQAVEVDTISVGDDFYISGDTDNVNINDSTVTINSGGTYIFSGTLKDGQIIVNASDSEKVNIVLNGVNISCSDSAPIYVKSADKTTITLSEGTENYISDGKSYTYEDETSDEPDAAIYSKDDLVIDGEGSLVVNGNYNDGITGKDDLKIKSGNITINAIADGIKGKDSLTIVDGNVTINAGADGMKSTNDTDTEKGYILIKNGNINITSAEDAIQADNYVNIKDGYFTIKSGGGNEMNNDKHQGDAPPNWNMDNSTSSDEEESISTKGIKAEKSITIDGGTFDIDSCDDALHSNDSIVINNGDINIKSGDDGIHADNILDINDGNIVISTSYESLEAGTVTINGGNINLTASDDGINASGDTNENILYVNGGYTVVNANGDGIDANGSIYVTDGTIIVNGPVENNNAAVDYDGTFKMSGGLLIAAGSSGMAQSVSESSTQNCVAITLTPQKADTLVHIENEDKDEVITYAPSKEFSSVVVCSPKLQTGSTYKVYVGGSYDGEEKDGLYSNGTYTNGEEVGSFTVSSINSRITQSGASSGNMGGGNMPGGNMPGGNKPGGNKPGENPSTNPSENEIVDKSSLQSLYDAHKDDTNEIYTTDTWNVFINALSNAESVLENPYASQSNVDDAYNTLNTAINNLEKDDSSNTDTSDSLDDGNLGLTTSLNSWPGGYIINCDIKNVSDETVNSWSLKIKKENLNIVNYWCVNCEDDGEYIIVTPKEWNSSLAPGQTINFGLQGTGTGSTDFSYELISE